MSKVVMPCFFGHRWGAWIRISDTFQEKVCVDCKKTKRTSIY